MIKHCCNLQLLIFTQIYLITTDNKNLIECQQYCARKSFLSNDTNQLITEADTLLLNYKHIARVKHTDVENAQDIHIHQDNMQQKDIVDNPKHNNQSEPTEDTTTNISQNKKLLEKLEFLKKNLSNRLTIKTEPQLTLDKPQLPQ